MISNNRQALGSNTGSASISKMRRDHGSYLISTTGLSMHLHTHASPPVWICTHIPCTHTPAQTCMPTGVDMYTHQPRTHAPAHTCIPTHVDMHTHTYHAHMHLHRHAHKCGYAYTHTMHTYKFNIKRNMFMCTVEFNICPLSHQSA